MKYSITHHIKVISTTKTFYIFNKKIGSRYLEAALGQMGTEVYITDGDFVNPRIASADNKEAKSIKTDLDSIIESKSKKDIIIVYRNPINRFTTAIVQDLFTKQLNGIPRVLFYSLLLEGGFLPKEIDFLDFAIDHPKSPIIVENHTKFSEMVSFITNHYLNNLTYMNIEVTHSNFHCTPVLEFIISNKLDLNKITLIDLDNPKDDLGSYLKTQEISISNLDKEGNSLLLKEIINECIIKRTSNIIPTLLSSEISSYRILNNFRNN